MELAAELAPPDRKVFYHDQIGKYEERKTQIAAKAHEIEKQVDEANHRSEGKEHPQHLFGQALAWLSVAISLAAITSLTSNRKLFALAGLMGAAGVGVSIFALLHL
jgi:hypothetical protein